MTSPSNDSASRSLPQGTGGTSSAAAPADALRIMLSTLIHETIEREFTQFLGAQPFECTAQRRGIRNGYRRRQFTTRVGTLELRIPRDRAGRFQLGVWLNPSETGLGWRRVFEQRLQRGFTGVQYVVSDEHAGLVDAIRRFFPDAVHQRCQVHYLRKALDRVSIDARAAGCVAGAVADVGRARDGAQREMAGQALCQCA